MSSRFFSGPARKTTQVQTRFKALEAQRAWPEEDVFKNGQELMCPAFAWVAMKARFTKELREDTSTPMWPDKDQISIWLADKIKARKERQRGNKKAARCGTPAGTAEPGVSEDEEDDEDDGGGGNGGDTGMKQPARKPENKGPGTNDSKRKAEQSTSTSAG